MKALDRVRKCGEPSITLSSISRQKLFPSYQYTLRIEGRSRGGGQREEKALPLLGKVKGAESIKKGQ